MNLAGVAQLRLSQGLYALVSVEDYAWLSEWKWTASWQGRNGSKVYAIRFERKGENRRRVKVHMHREVAKRALAHRAATEPTFNYGILQKGQVVDHINHNSLDNRRENLQTLTQIENMRRAPGWGAHKV